MKKRKNIPFHSLIKGRFLRDHSVLFPFSVVSFKGNVQRSAGTPAMVLRLSVRHPIL